MSTRREERERMRQERLAAQQAATSSEKRRLYLGYAVAGVIVAAIVAGIVVAITGGGGDGETPEASDFPQLAYIQPLIGVIPDGVDADGREGIAPPAPQTAILEDAAKAANCDLQLNLEDEGNTHLEDEDKKVNYKTNPPTSGDHYGDATSAGSGAGADGAYLTTPPESRLVHSMEHLSLIHI